MSLEKLHDILCLFGGNDDPFILSIYAYFKNCSTVFRNVLNILLKYFDEIKTEGKHYEPNNN